DPTDDLSQQPIPGLLHKYHGRALLITTGACAIHCRYCFRRHYPYQSKQIKPSHWQQILQYLANDNSIHEIILSGGDPFTLSDTKLLPFLDDLEAIPHLQTIRFHTRLLSFTPERLTTAFTNWLKDTSTSVVIVYHINHAQELSEPLHHTTKKLQQLSVTQLNQSVLLKGINDDADTLAQLNQQLFQYRILPYYLHQLDLVQGAAHFKVSDTEAKLIHHTLQQRLPGYLVPKLVYEAPHTGSKQWL
ncbi:MAG: KamA family radical SAM protein, partial [Methylococcales bacterium]|nr:KamA family radical SAM protein [Methylococcales bacterium]